MSSFNQYPPRDEQTPRRTPYRSAQKQSTPIALPGSSTTPSTARQIQPPVPNRQNGQQQYHTPTALPQSRLTNSRQDSADPPAVRSLILPTNAPRIGMQSLSPRRARDRDSRDDRSTIRSYQEDSQAPHQSQNLPGMQDRGNRVAGGLRGLGQSDGSGEVMTRQDSMPLSPFGSEFPSGSAPTLTRGMNQRQRGQQDQALTIHIEQYNAQISAQNERIKSLEGSNASLRQLVLKLQEDVNSLKDNAVEIVDPIDTGNKTAGKKKKTAMSKAEEDMIKTFVKQAIDHCYGGPVTSPYPTGEWPRLEGVDGQIGDQVRLRALCTSAFSTTHLRCVGNAIQLPQILLASSKRCTDSPPDRCH